MGDRSLEQICKFSTTLLASLLTVRCQLTFLATVISATSHNSPNNPRKTRSLASCLRDSERLVNLFEVTQGTGSELF